MGFSSSFLSLSSFPLLHLPPESLDSQRGLPCPTFLSLSLIFLRKNIWYLWISCPHVGLCTTCMPGAWGLENGVDLQKLELQSVVSHHWVLEIDPEFSARASSAHTVSHLSRAPPPHPQARMLCNPALSYYIAEADRSVKIKDLFTMPGLCSTGAQTHSFVYGRQTLNPIISPAF